MAALNLNSKYIRRETNVTQTVPTNLDFTGKITIQDAVEDTSPVSKKQLNEAIQNAGAGIDTSNFANTKTENTFEKNTTFTANATQGIQVIDETDQTEVFNVNAENAKFKINPVVETPKTFENLSDGALVSKGVMVEQINAIKITAETAPDRVEPVGTLWLKTSFTQDPDDNTIFTDIPGLYISLGEHGWWDIHAEKLI